MACIEYSTCFSEFVEQHFTVYLVGLDKPLEGKASNGYYFYIPKIEDKLAKPKS